MPEVSNRIFLGSTEVIGFYDNKVIGINPYTEPSTVIQFRNDPYSASLFLAVPGSQFSTLGMSSPLQDVSALIKGVGTNVSLISTGSGQLYASSSVLNYSGSNWATEGYTTATVTANQKNLGAQNNGTTSYRNSTRGCSFSHIGRSLPTGGPAILTNIVNNFERTLQRNVF